MKLFTRYSRINIISSILIFLGGCIAFYFVLNYVLIKQLDEGLETEQAEINHFIKGHNSLPEIINTDDQQIYFSIVNNPLSKEIYSSEKIWNSHENEQEWMRKLVFGVTASGKYYKVLVIKSQEQKEELLKLVLMIAAAMVALILLATFLINRIVLKKLWQPFYQSIHAISQYNLHRQQTLDLPETSIQEFALLNNNLKKMVNGVEQDYLTLKEFTSNAAHEMQTPLAVITANTESLIQDEKVLASHHLTIATIDNAAKRLSRLNQSLLLLAKIESRRFHLDEKVQWDKLIKQRLEELKDMTASQHLQIITAIQPLSSTFQEQLADILISNLLGNAMRYNVEGGVIEVLLNETELRISNTSALPPLDETKIFNRFYRHPQTTAAGSGLGLSIIQQVCNLAGYTLRYHYSKGMHVFVLNF